MVKFTSILIVWLSYTLPLFSQNIRTATFRNYPVVANVDSLEKTVMAQKNNPDQYLLGLVTLERSRGQLSSDKFGQYLPRIDSLSRSRNLPNIQAAYYTLEASRINYDGHERVKTLEYLNRALELFTQQRDTTGMIRCLSSLRYLNINGTQRVDGSTEMAEMYFHRLILLASKSGWPGDKLTALSARQAYFISRKQPDSVIVLSRQALNIISDNPEFDYLKAGQLNYQAIAYEHKGDYRRMLRLLLECLRLTPDQWYSSKRLYNRNVGNAYSKLNDFARAESYFKESVRLGELHKSAANIQIDAVYSVALAQYNQKKYEEAIDNFMKTDSLKNVMQAELRTKDFLELQTKYETEKKERANLDLQHEKHLYEIGIVISVVLLGIISLLLFYLYRKNTQILWVENP